MDHAIIRLTSAILALDCIDDVTRERAKRLREKASMRAHVFSLFT